MNDTYKHRSVDAMNMDESMNTTHKWIGPITRHYKVLVPWVDCIPKLFVGGSPTFSHLQSSHIFPQPKRPPPVPTLKVDPSQRPRRWRLKSPPLHWDPPRIKQIHPTNPWWDPNKSINKSFQTPTNPSTNPGGSWITKRKITPLPSGKEEGSLISHHLHWKEKRKLIGLKFRCRLGRDNVMAPGMSNISEVEQKSWSSRHTEILHVPWPLLWPLQTPQLLWLPSLREVLQIPGPGVTMVTTESFHTLKSQNLIFFTLSRTSSSESF